MSKVDLKKDHEKRPKIKVARKHKRDTKLQGWYLIVTFFLH